MDPQNQYESRFIVGIDLGTTSIEVSYVDTAKGLEIHPFHVLQLVAASETAERETLPSYCYLPAKQDLPAGALDLPWSDDLNHAVGYFARERGAGVPGRLVASAKSWLAHPGVDRDAKILPWGCRLGQQAISPVTASRYYLDHVREAWNRRFGSLTDEDGTPCVLSEQQVVLTVPASFDEVARELTVRAAREAGIERLVLLEEPLAAFYSWLQCNETDWQSLVKEGDVILVADIGGGTTDFSLIEIEQGYHVRRMAVGDHLLLGGDNIDMALARDVEKRWKTKLPARQWGALCQQCRQSKEKLLSKSGMEKAPVTLVGAGSSVIGGARKSSIKRERLDELLLDGFFPEIDADGSGPSRRSGMREMGLPYASDPAITKHLLSFLRLANPDHSEQRKRGAKGEPLVPTRVLYNGGALIPSMLRVRLGKVLGGWAGRKTKLPELKTMDLRRAVSHGAAYYGLVRRGQGQRVRGGIARSYYMEVQAKTASALLCVMPRDKDEGDVVELREHSFQLSANQAVRFPLYSSSTRLGDKVGAILEDREEISELPALQTVLQFGKRAERTLLEVRIGAMLNEVGTLDMWCVTTDEQHRYPLTFDLRAPAATDDAEQGETEVIVSESVLQEADQLIRRDFESEVTLAGMVRELEELLRIRKANWGVTLLRALADMLLEIREVRLRSPEHEKRWLNLTGLCMRPGFGYPGDELRIREFWKLWHDGCRFETRTAVFAEWWIAWRRIAGGLKVGHHEQLYNALRRHLIDPKTKLPGPKQRESQDEVEMWRCLGALEHLDPGLKRKLLRPFLEAAKGWKDHHYWAVARLGARRLLYGPANGVIPAERLAPLLKPFFKQVKRARSRTVPLALTSLCRLTGVRDLDFPIAIRKDAMALLEDLPNAEQHTKPLRVVCEVSRQTQGELAGDRLPLGLKMTPGEA